MIPLALEKLQVAVKALSGVASWAPGTQGQVIPPSEGLPHLRVSGVGFPLQLYAGNDERKRRLLEENQEATEH